MARRQLLSNDTWARHLEPPADEREIARHYTLGPDDLAHVIDKRGDANRLGYALVTLKSGVTPSFFMPPMTRSAVQPRRGSGAISR